MPRLSAAEVVAGVGGTLMYGSNDMVFSNVSIDTRKLQGGDVFFAIRGPNQDGHRYIPDALSKGALGAVAEHSYVYPGEFPDGKVLIKAGDTHEALKNLAISVRQRWPGILVAVTGSMGKTTTREFAAHVMSSRFRVYRTPGNYNNLFGLPLALFGLNGDQDFGIFEMGMSAHGEIAEMCRIAAPVVGIITNVAPVHLEFFSSLEDIARAKGELAEALPQDGTLIYNADDRLVCEIAGRFDGQKISFGLSENADVRAEDIRITGLEETRFRLNCRGESIETSIPVAGIHYVLNILPAIALGSRFDIPVNRMTGTFGTLRQASMRGQILRFAKGCTVIDDSYNSNPNALRKMIEVLAAMPSFERRILIAGEMLELGSGADSLHFECGRYAAGRHIDLVVGVRGCAREIVRGAIDGGMTQEQAHFFPDADASLDFIAGELRSGDIVLIKGSRGVRLEKVVQKLKAELAMVSE